MTAGAALVEQLRSEGVTHVFGLIGTSLLEVLDALHESPDITYVGVRHEQNAAHMADGYARISGRAGVVLACQPGPGVTNIVTGIAQARLAFSPVVAIAGSPDSSHFDRGTFQEIDQQGLFAPIAKSSTTVHQAARVPEYVRNAFRISQSGRRGPSVVNIPSDLLGQKIDATVEAPETNRAQSAPAPSPAAIARVVEIIKTAERPLILAGGGVKWARASGKLVQLAEKLNAPVVASAGNSDVVPNDHPLYAGQVGPRGNKVATDLARNADVIIAMGTRLGFNTTFFSYDNISADAKIIQVDIDSADVGRHFAIAEGIVADAGETIDALLAEVDTRESGGRWVDAMQAARRELLDTRAAAAASAESPLTPAAVCAGIQASLPRNGIVAVDTGTCCMQSTDVMQTFEGPSFMTPLDFGLVGFAFAAGLGAKAAAPDRPVISIMGDGGFGMSMTELSTAVSSGLNTVTVVMNNSAWGAEKAYQRDYYGARYVGADLVNPAFDEVARAFGAIGVKASSVDDVSSAVADAIKADRPTVIEVAVDPDAIVSLRRDVFAHRVGKE